MREKPTKLDTSIANTGFGAFLCYALGFVLLEIRVVQLEGKLIAHAVVVAIGTLLLFALHRAIVPYHVAAAVRSSDALADKDDRGSGIIRPASGVLLCMFGYVGALVLSSGSMTLFAIFVTSACTLPWLTIPLCRTSILVPAALITVANVLGMLTTDQPRHPLHIPLAVWMLWMGATGIWLINIFNRRQKSRESRLLAEKSNEEPTEAMRA